MSASLIFLFLTTLGTVGASTAVDPEYGSILLWPYCTPHVTTWDDLSVGDCNLHGGYCGDPKNARKNLDYVCSQEKVPPNGNRSPYCDLNTTHMFISVSVFDSLSNLYDNNLPIYGFGGGLVDEGNNPIYKRIVKAISNVPSTFENALASRPLVGPGSTIQKQFPVCSPGAYWWSGSKETGVSNRNCDHWWSASWNPIEQQTGTIGSKDYIQYTSTGCGDTYNYVCACLRYSPTASPTTGAPTVPTPLPTRAPTASPTLPTSSPTRYPTLYEPPQTAAVILYSDQINRKADYLYTVGGGSFQSRAQIYCRDIVNPTPPQCDSFGFFTVLVSRSTLPMRTLFEGSVSVYSFILNNYTDTIYDSLTSNFSNIFSPGALLNLPSDDWWSGTDAFGNYTGKTCLDWTDSTNFSDTAIAGDTSDVDYGSYSCGAQKQFICACSVPTQSPSRAPTLTPSNSPSASPTLPTRSPSFSPSLSPSLSPTASPTPAPSASPTPAPTFAPSRPPTPPLMCNNTLPACALHVVGTHVPTESPTSARRRRVLFDAPTTSPSFSPTTEAPTDSPTPLTPFGFDPAANNGGVLFQLLSFDVHNNGTLYDVYDVSFTFDEPPCVTNVSDVHAVAIVSRTYEDVFNFFCSNSFVMGDDSIFVLNDLEGDNVDYLSKVSVRGRLSFLQIFNVSEPTVVAIHDGIQPTLLNVNNNTGLQILRGEMSAFTSSIALQIDSNPQLRYVDFSNLSIVNDPLQPFGIFQIVVSGENLMVVKFGELRFDYILYGFPGFNFLTIEGSNVERIHVGDFNVSSFDQISNTSVVIVVNPPYASERFAFGMPNCTQTYLCVDRCDAFLNDCVAPESVPDHDYLRSCTQRVGERCAAASSYVYDRNCWIPSIEMVNLTIRGVVDWANLSRVDCVLDANHYVNVSDTLTIEHTTITSARGLERVRASRVIVRNATALTALYPGCAGLMDWEVYSSVCFVNTISPSRSPTLPTTSPTRAPTSSPTQGPTKQPTFTPSKSPTQGPTESPTQGPTKQPTVAPTKSPTRAPSKSPSVVPTESPTKSPTKSPTVTSASPSSVPTGKPTTQSPTTAPSQSPTQSTSPQFSCERTYRE